MAKTRQPKIPGGGMVQTSCSIPADTHAQLVAIAEREERSVSFLLAKAAREFVERDAKSKGK
jgi:hypothetical protein